MSVNQLIDQILNSMVNSEDHTFRLSKQQCIIELLERDELLIMEKLWPQKRVNMVEFIKIMVQIVHHKQPELLFLVMGLIELFKDIVAASQENELALSDVTSYVCTNETTQTTMIAQQLIPEPKKFNLNQTRIREIDMDAPKVIGFSEEELCHVVSGNIVTDSIRHHNGHVHTGLYYNKSVVTLDSLDSKLNIYNLDGTLKQQLKISQSEDKETIILGFAWSDRQQRFGMTLKSHALCFYEGDYKTSRIFSTVLASQDYQTNIWFLENQCKWITTDASCRLYEWDLQSESAVNIYSNKALQGTVIEVVEVVHMKMVATASLDKQLLVWDLNTKDVKIIVSLKDQGGIHSLVYSYTYQIFITCGYSTNISLYEINPKFHDVTLVGKLTGHTSMLTSVTMIGKSPVLVSGDDCGGMRLWDVRTFACLQCLNFGKRTQITKLLDMSDHLMISFLGSRVNILKLDTRKKDLMDNYAVRIEFDQQRDELIVASKKNILFYDIHTGRVKQLLNGLLGDIEDEITQFRPLNYFNKFILGDQRGNMKIYQHNGEYISSLKGHSDVLALKLDILNKLVITAGQDEVIVQRMNGEVLRESSPIKVSNLDVSIHHSLIFVTSLNMLYMLDYEFAKCLTILEFPTEITAILFLANYPIYVVSLTNGKVYFMNFTIKDHVSVHSTIYAIYETGHNNFMTEDTEQEFVHKIILSQPELELVFATSDGNIIRLDLGGQSNLTPTPSVHERINYNPFRKCQESPLGVDPIKVEDNTKSSKQLTHLLLFNVSKKYIIGLNFLQLDTRLIMISSVDGMIRVFDLNGIQLATVNINHPLPIKWELRYTKHGELRKRIVYGFKVIDILRKQSKTEKEAEVYSLNDSIQQTKITPIKIPKRNRAIVMKDEFSPRDLQYKKIRHLYQNELQGASLKQMEAQRKLLEVQNMFKNDPRDPKLEQLIKQKEKEKIKAQDRAIYMNYLDPDMRDRNQMPPVNLHNEHMQLLSNRLDNKEFQVKASVPQMSMPIRQPSIQKKKSVSDFYQYAASRNLLNDNTDSFSSQTTLKLLRSQQVSQINSIVSNNDMTWHGQHRKQQRDLSQVLHGLNMRVKHSKNSAGEQQTLLPDISKSELTFEDQLDEFTRKHKFG